MNDLEQIKESNLFQLNEITGATYWYLDGKQQERFKLNGIQTKILKIAMSMVNPFDEVSGEYTFHISEFMLLMGIKNKTTQYIDIPLFLDVLMSKDNFKTVKADGKIKIIHIFDMVEYDPRTYNVKFSFSRTMLNYLTGMDGSTDKDKQYTKYRLGNILNFKSEYSVAFYELLKAELKGREKIEVNFTIEQLREWLGLGKGKHTRYTHFRKHVLEKARDEINMSNIDIKLEFDDSIRKNKKVVEIKFIIKGNVKEKYSTEIAVTKTKGIKKQKGHFNTENVGVTYQGDNLDTIENRLLGWDNK